MWQQSVQEIHFLNMFSKFNDIHIIIIIQPSEARFLYCLTYFKECVARTAVLVQVILITGHLAIVQSYNTHTKWPRFEVLTFRTPTWSRGCILDAQQLTCIYTICSIVQSYDYNLWCSFPPRNRHLLTVFFLAKKAP